MTTVKLFEDKTLEGIYRKCLTALTFFPKKFFFRYDRRCKFYDLAKINPQYRKARSPIIQFYSSVDNIGNYLPILGIRKMLSQTTDTWCVHDKLIDFKFINMHYKCAIIGGAGLLHKGFEPFWKKILHECKLPIIIWGVGVCLHDRKTRGSVDSKIVTEVAKRCDLINVRDDLTADYYSLKKAHISACPTIVYLRDFQKSVGKNNNIVLFSSHEELLSASETERIKTAILRVTTKFQYTNNIQQRFLGLDDIIYRYYCKSRLVVTTRLHGAIIAYGLGIPYIIIPRDEKLRAFHRIYSNGISISNDSQLENALRNGNIPIIKPIKIDQVLDFGDQALRWVFSMCS